MAIVLKVEPRKVVTWEEFATNYPDFSIALDGYCSGPTRSSPSGLHLNLNHHEGEDPIALLVRSLNHLLRPQGWTGDLRQATRQLLNQLDNGLPKPTADAVQALRPLLTVLASDPSTRFRNPVSGDDAHRMAIRSTTDQALCQVKLGLFDTYQVNGEPTATLWVNDFDEDVQISTFLLMNPDVADNKLFRELAKVEDYLDMSAGLFPVKKRGHVIRRLCWISQPYTDAKLSGDLFSMDGPTMHTRLLETHERLQATIDGHGDELEPDARYEVLADHGFWKVVREIGAHARLGLAEDGVKAFVSVRNEVPGHYRYTLARLSKFVPAPLVAFAEHMNALEGIGPESSDRWGGSDTVIGPPRLAGTRFAPHELEAEFDAFLREHARAA